MCLPALMFTGVFTEHRKMVCYLAHCVSVGSGPHYQIQDFSAPAILNLTNTDLYSVKFRKEIY